MTELLLALLMIAVLGVLVVLVLRWRQESRRKTAPRGELTVCHSAPGS
jgi:type II secretory pathway pseudopilin PulG